MFEITYNENHEVVDALIEHINENSIYHAFTSHNADILIRRKFEEGVPFKRLPLVYTLTFMDGVMYLSDNDVLFHHTPLWRVSDLQKYDDREVLSHHDEAATVKEDMTQIMDLFMETKITWEPSQEEIDEAREEGHSVYGYSFSGLSVEADLMTCYGFQGDVHWLKCLEALISPIIQPGLELEFNPENPLEVFIKASYTNTVIVLTHPMTVEDESRPRIRQGEHFYLTPSDADRGFGSLRKLHAVYRLIDRSGHDLVRDMYRSLVKEG